MCFSASASFAASGALAVAGGASLAIATPRQRLLAVVPLVFAAQQAFEGVQWLALNSGTTCQSVGRTYLLLALALWPTYLPIAVYLLDERRRRLHRWLIGIGAAVSMYLLVMLMLLPLEIVVINQSIRYLLPVPFSFPATIMYVLATCGSLLSSSLRYVQLLGVLLLLTGGVSLVLFATTALSVWCFFAAVVSVSIGIALYAHRRAR